MISVTYTCTYTFSNWPPYIIYSQSAVTLSSNRGAELLLSSLEEELLSSLDEFLDCSAAARAAARFMRVRLFERYISTCLFNSFSTGVCVSPCLVRIRTSFVFMKHLTHPEICNFQFIFDAIFDTLWLRTFYVAHNIYVLYNLLYVKFLFYL